MGAKWFTIPIYRFFEINKKIVELFFFLSNVALVVDFSQKFCFPRTRFFKNFFYVVPTFSAETRVAPFPFLKVFGQKKFRLNSN